MAEAGEFLRVSDLHAWYGESHILHGVDLTVHEGEVVTLLGRNGAGRTTTLRAIMGLTGSRKGSITIQGVSLTVNAVAGAEFDVNLIPHTLAHTNLGVLAAGAKVNIEVDTLARYAERLSQFKD